MIVPNLLVSNLKRSVDFYQTALGFDLMMVLTAGNDMIDDPADENAVFATLVWNTHQLMLQTLDHVKAAGVSEGRDVAPGLSGSLYVRDFPFDAILSRIPPTTIIRAPELAWYGMLELVVEDPDGYRIVLGRREGAPPT